MDVEFIGRTAYVLVTLVGSDVGGSDTVGIYRVDGPTSFTVVADIGAFAVAIRRTLRSTSQPESSTRWRRYRGGFLVTDGHHNRVLRVTLDGEVSERIAFGNIVPTGLAVRGSKVYMAEAGPVPHLPEDGKVVSFRHKSSTATQSRLRRAASSSTSSSAAVAPSTRSRRASSAAAPRVLRRCRTPAAW